jgi:uncharacterized protein YkwD
VLLLWMALSSAACASDIISRPPASAAHFTNYSASSFRKLPEARKTIEAHNVNQKLLDAAVFHETNRRRAEHGLRALAYDSKAEAMARIQARAMAKGEFVAHENPDPKRKTMEDRAKVVGLRARVLAENVASAFGRRYKSGQSFYTRQESGRTIYSYEPDGPPIPMHTYITFAEALVDGWMKSPGHRKNILHKEPTHLGCACELPAKTSAMETFYCAQVFFAPLDSKVTLPRQR